LSELFGNDYKNNIVDKYDVFLINEGQFFKDLYDCVDIIVNEKKKKVYVCGLDGDYKRKKFGSILDIIPLCDDIVKLKGICKECFFKESIFTNRITGEKEQTLVSSNNYNSLCRKCYNKIM
jgi:thymidine kinase